MQAAYISGLMELAEKDHRVCHVLADSGTNYDKIFGMNFPERIFNFGIAEQNAVGIAAGMAGGGKIPFVFIQGAFLVYRALEFVRDDICFQNVNVKLTGQGSGISLAGLGPSHHTTEDVAILRVLPNMHIFSPATPIQVRACIVKMYETVGPCYMRIGMSGEKEFYHEKYVLPDCGQDVIREGKDIVIFTTGCILEETVAAADILVKDDGLEVMIVNVARLKPFDESLLLDVIWKFRCVFTVEEHQISGGLGGIISETVTTYGMNVKVVRIGIEDTFARGYAATPKQIRIENRIDAQSLAKRIKSEVI